MSPELAKHHIEIHLQPNRRFTIKNEIARIKYILNCINSYDWAIRQEINNFIINQQSQYIKIIENPDKYRILL
jgi:hypothetical protein